MPDPIFDALQEEWMLLEQEKYDLEQDDPIANSERIDAIEKRIAEIAETPQFKFRKPKS